ncbi:MAG: hypothetical protein V1835_04310 [Candidatus Micrarchaeota archaeon]
MPHFEELHESLGKQLRGIGYGIAPEEPWRKKDRKIDDNHYVVLAIEEPLMGGHDFRSPLREVIRKFADQVGAAKKSIVSCPAESNIFKYYILIPREKRSGLKDRIRNFAGQKGLVLLQPADVGRNLHYRWVEDRIADLGKVFLPRHIDDHLLRMKPASTEQSKSLAAFFVRESRLKRPRFYAMPILLRHAGRFFGTKPGNEKLEALKVMRAAMDRMVNRQGMHFALQYSDFNRVREGIDRAIESVK